jgi:hypothetical protein
MLGVRRSGVRNVLVEQLHFSVAIFAAVHSRLFFQNHIRDWPLNPAPNIATWNPKCFLYFNRVDLVSHGEDVTA